MDMKNNLIHFAMFLGFTLCLGMLFLFALSFVFNDNVLHALASTVIAGMGFFAVVMVKEVTSLSNQIFELKQMLEEMKKPKQTEKEKTEKTEYIISKF